MISRRSFFTRAAAALICAPAIVRVASIMPVSSMAIYPTLIGDGVADDTFALQAASDRKPFYFNGILHRASEGSRVYVPHGTFRLKNTLLLRESKVTFNRSRFLYEGNDEKPIIHVLGNGKDYHLMNIDLEYLPPEPHQLPALSPEPISNEP